MSPGDIIAIIGATAAAIVSIITAFRQSANHQETKDKLDAIHKDVNQ